MQTIPLTNSPLLAIVDDRIFERASELRWGLDKRNGYVRSTDRPNYIYLHHLVFGKPSPGKEVDHKNTNKLDCQRKNLREATHSQNQWNRTKYKCNNSGFKGVCLTKSGRYEVSIKVKGVQRSLGTFSSPIEAAKAYDRAAKKLFGEFARTNFPMRFCREPRFPR